MKKLTMLLIALTSSLAFAEQLKVDLKESRVEWKGGKKNGSFHNGDISIQSGTVDVDAKGMVTAANVVIDMKTIKNEDVKDPEYNKKLVDHLSSKDFFDVENFPVANFKFKSMKATGVKDEYEVTGDLTMIGKTHEVKFPAKITVAKGVLTGTGVINVERLKWDLKYGSASFFKTLTVDKIINDNFELKLKIVAKK